MTLLTKDTELNSRADFAFVMSLTLQVLLLKAQNTCPCKVKWMKFDYLEFCYGFFFFPQILNLQLKEYEYNAYVNNNLIDINNFLRKQIIWPVAQEMSLPSKLLKISIFH